MATIKKKASGAPAEGGQEAPAPARTAPVKPRNIAAYESAVAEFGTACELFAKGQYAEAKRRFDAVAAASAQEEPILADRARSYASICGRKAAPEASGAGDAASLYHRGVVAANAGQLDEAWALLEKALEARPGDASVLYARASVRGLQGNAAAAAAELKKSIAIDPVFRYQAVSDSDFDKVRDEAVFIDVIEPSHAGA